MKYVEAARRAFQEIADNTPAHSCSLLIHEDGSLIDAGCACPGGWSTAISVLKGLTGERGQVSFAQRMVGTAQLPAVEIFQDDPEGMAVAFARDADGLLGVRDGDEYVLGVSLNGTEAARKSRGNLVAAEPAVAKAHGLDAGGALHGAGVADIQWGWCSCPVAPFTHDGEQAAQTRSALHSAHGVVNLWVRGDKQAIQTAVNSFGAGKLYVHELATACTYVKNV